jgi:flagellar protein FliO/FliZ
MEFLDTARYLGALFVVLALLAAAALAARKFGVPGVTKGISDKRLTVVETLMLGPRQRLFILRRDSVEHLVMTAPEGISVIESGFSAPRTLKQDGFFADDMRAAPEPTP